MLIKCVKYVVGSQACVAVRWCVAPSLIGHRHLIILEQKECGECECERPTRQASVAIKSCKRYLGSTKVKGIQSNQILLSIFSLLQYVNNWSLPVQQYVDRFLSVVPTVHTYVPIDRTYNAQVCTYWQYLQYVGRCLSIVPTVGRWVPIGTTYLPDYVRQN